MPPGFQKLLILSMSVAMSGSPLSASTPRWYRDSTLWGCCCWSARPNAPARKSRVKVEIAGHESRDGGGKRGGSLGRRFGCREAPGHPVRRPVEVIGHRPQFHETETNDDFGQPVGDLFEVGIDPLRIARRPDGGCAPGALRFA